MSKLRFSLLLPAFLLVLPLSVWAGAEKLQEMSEMFDRMDRQDFLDGLEKAQTCTAKRDFHCADVQLTQIKKLINGAEDAQLWKLASANRTAEKLQVQDEAQQRQAAQRQQQEQQRQQQIARQQALQQQQAAQESADDFQWGKAAVLLGGAAVGGLSQLPAETQVQVVSGLLQDSSGGQEGISNVQGALATSSASADSYGGSSSGGSAVPGDPAFDAGEQACQAAANQNARPYNDPQVDTLCVLASSNQCVSRKFNYSGYDAETAATCNNLRGLVSAMGVSNQCAACR